MERSLDEIAEDPTVEEQVVYPLYVVEDGDSSPDDRREAIASELSEADVVVVGDTDADGLSTTGILNAKHSDENLVYVPAGHRGGAIELAPAVDLVADNAPQGIRVYVVDLAPDDETREEYLSALESLSEGRDARVRDHHDWTADDIETLERAGIDVEIADEKCSAEVVQQADWPDAPEKYVELARITALHDLWKEDEWGDETRHRDLSNYAFWADTHEDYIEAVAEHGPDIRDSPEIDRLLTENEREKEQKIGYEVENADWEVIEGYDVAFAYGTAYPSGVGSELLGAGADVAVMIKPLGGVSLRCSEDAPFATRIAQVYGGNGHPSGEAAGCESGMVVSKHEAIGNAAKISYGEHWQSRGSYVATLLESTIERVIRDIENDPDADPTNPETFTD